MLYLTISVLMILVARQCGGKVKTVEDKYEEERSKKKAHLEEKVKSSEIQVDPVDVLPVKNLDGTLHYRTGYIRKQFLLLFNGTVLGFLSVVFLFCVFCLCFDMVQ